MSKIDQLYTVGKWVTKPGFEKQFISGWEAFAKWTAVNIPGAGTGSLLQNRERPQEFISFGPWESPEAVKAWRESPEFKKSVSQLREMCEEFQPQSFTLVASSR